MKIGANTTVFIEYDLYTKDKKELLESTDGEGKIAYMHGKGMMLDALEKEMEGQEEGDEFAVELSVEEAFGPRNEEMVATLPKEQFAEVGEIAVGDEFQTHDTDGNPIMVTITSIEGDEVTIDGNHPYAGLEVVFEIKVLEVRETTEEDVKNFSGHHHHHEHGEGCGCDSHDHGDDHECCGGAGHEDGSECCGGSSSGGCGCH
ncbi:MAG: peptidylprolyl isomerase [Spirochaetales bacterium]|nr:peptidylprolyl isomerase [Spirochaetales bacterium]